MLKCSNAAMQYQEPKFSDELTVAVVLSVPYTSMYGLNDMGHNMAHAKAIFQHNSLLGKLVSFNLVHESAVAAR